MESLDEIDGPLPKKANLDLTTSIDQISGPAHIFKQPLTPLLSQENILSSPILPLSSSPEKFDKESPIHIDNQQLSYKLPTPPISDTESVSGSTTESFPESRFKMPCLCKAKNCRKFLFF